MVILDTSIIIDHLRRQNPDSALINLLEKHNDEKFAVSVISIQELYEGRSTRDKNKEHDLLTTLSPFEILPYTLEIAESAGKIARDLKISINFADAAIAATALINQGSLFTLNTKHFINISRLELFKT